MVGKAVLNMNAILKINRKVLVVALTLVLSAVVVVRTVSARQDDMSAMRMAAVAEFIEAGTQCIPALAHEVLDFGLLRECMAPAVAQLVGSICVSWQWLCTEKTLNSWLPMFLEKERQVSDVIVSDSETSILGEDEDLHWQLRIPNEEDGTALFSVLQEMPSADIQTRH